MSNAELMFNATQRLSDVPPILAAHPVLIVVVGSAQGQIAPLLHAQCAGARELTLFRVVMVDSLPYPELVTRQVQEGGWPRAQVQEALPPSHYFHLSSPFLEEMDFDHPLNQHWRDTLFDPRVQRQAARPEAPGCAGTPALGRARVEGLIEELRAFFARHVQALTQIRTATLALHDGILAFVVTTYRGGTGTGATLLGSAVLRAALQGDAHKIHLLATMPCVYGGDQRTYANAFAMLRETQWFHRYGGNVPTARNGIFKAPFTSVTYTFVSNGGMFGIHVKTGHKALDDHINNVNIVACVLCNLPSFQPCIPWV